MIYTDVQINLSDPSDMYPETESVCTATNDDNDSLPSTSSVTSVDPKFDRAMFLLHSTNSLSLNYSSIEKLCESTQTLIEQTAGQMQQKIL